MSGTELDAAGITDSRLRAAYQHCRSLNARHGRTYFLATRLLSPAQRPAVHALYGFARWVDDIVDEAAAGVAPAQVATELNDIGNRLRAGIIAGTSPNPIVRAVVDAMRRFDVHTTLFDDFLYSMRMDLTTTSYPTRDALDSYVRGSAEAIGLQVLPVLGTIVPMDEAAPHAAKLGNAFQLTNFLRDIAEDLARDRIYLPADELAAFGVDRELLNWCARTGRTEPKVCRAIAAQIATTRRIYREARPGLRMLHPISRPCVRTAFTLYSEILDRIEAADYNVFRYRATVTKRRRFAVAGGAWARALWTRHRPTPASVSDGGQA